jgi:plastocyanin
MSERLLLTGKEHTMNYRYSYLWRLLGILLIGAALAACGDSRSSREPAPGDAPVGGLPAGGSGPAVQVVEKEFSMAFDSTQIKAGPVTFFVKNDGHAPHDFRIRGNGVDQKTEMLQSGETGQFTVDLPPGTYSYQCTVGGHEQLGMQGTLTVAP